MKKNEVQIGETYRCKVSGSVADVRITAENPHGGWDGVNVLTNRKVHIKSSQRLRGKASQRPAKRKKIVSLAEYEAEVEQASAERAAGQVRKDIAKTVKAVRNGDLAKGVTVPTGAKKATKATKDAKPSRKRHTGQRGANGAKRPSGLDAAAKVLAEAKEPLGAKEMVERMLAKGIWQTTGRTPSATIYAAIIREIAAKGSDARFRKTARGMFELAE